jgi:hypothetical protein
MDATGTVYWHAMGTFVQMDTAEAKQRLVQGILPLDVHSGV